MRLDKLLICKLLFVITSFAVLSVLYATSKISFFESQTIKPKVSAVAVYCADKSDKHFNLFSLQKAIKVSVYYESLCPYSIRFITQQLYPNYYRFAASLDVDLVPYGKADVSVQGFSICELIL